MPNDLTTIRRVQKTLRDLYHAYGHDWAPHITQDVSVTLIELEDWIAEQEKEQRDFTLGRSK